MKQESFESIFTFDNLLKAHYASRKNKRHKKEVILYEENLLINIENLRRRLVNGKYIVTSYNKFKIYEPKERHVAALSYENRIVQHCFCDNYLTPLLENRLIFDNAACRKNKGTDFARERVGAFLSKFYRSNKQKGYILRFDIHHYFEEIDHSILKAKIRKIIKDVSIYNFCEMIIDSFNHDSGKGLPLGNQTSQAFALFYLDSLDRIIKEKYKIKYYSRYMDDGILIHEDLNYLKVILEEITITLDSLNLSLNNKTRIMPIKTQCSFLGINYQVMNNGKIKKTVSHKKKSRIIKHLNSASSNNESRQSYVSYFSKFNEYFFLHNCLKGNKQ